jgi:hypothetical protein
LEFAAALPEPLLIRSNHPLTFAYRGGVGTTTVRQVDPLFLCVVEQFDGANGLLPPAPGVPHLPRGSNSPLCRGVIGRQFLR